MGRAAKKGRGAAKRPISVSRAGADRAGEGDSPIFADTKIGTGPRESPLLPPAVERWLRKNKAVLGISLFLVAGTLAVYGQTLGFEFVSYDDNPYVYENVHVTQGLTWASLKWAFAGVHSSNWHPLTSLSHILDWSLYGSWAGGHHLTNVLLHAAGAVVLFLALRGLTGATWRSGLVAALFCLHPLHVESVAWVSERKDVLSGLFFGLTLWAYAAYADSAGSREQGAGSRTGTKFPWGRYALVVVLFALGLLCKPMLVTLPFVLLLLDYWPLERWPSTSLARLVLEKLPLMALSAASSIVTYWVQAATGAVSEAVPPLIRVQTVLLGYVRYLAMLVCPFGLTMRYPRDQQAGILTIVLCGMALAFVSAAVLLLCRRRQRYVLVGWFWFMGMLVPVSGIVMVGEQSVADRYSYLTFTGLFVALVWGAAELAGRREKESAEAMYMPSPHVSLREREGSWLMCSGWVVAGVAIVFFGVRSFQQTGCWHDSEALYRQAMAVMPDNFMAHSNYGRALENRGKLDEAEKQYRESLAIEKRDFQGPVDYQAHTGLGLIERKRGNVSLAVDHYLAALKAKPDFAPAHNHLGVAYAMMGRMPEAEQEWTLALKYDPNMAEAEDNLGQGLQARKQYAEAVRHYRRAIELDSANEQFRVALAVALFAAGSFEEGIDECKKAIALRPEDINARNELARMYHTLGRLGEASAEWQEVLKRQPDNAAAAKGWGMALVKAGHGADALVQLRFALSVAPRDVETREYLALACIAAKQIKEGAAGFRAILDQDPQNQNALNSLAWIDATSGDDKLRNGKEAVELAEKAAVGRLQHQPNVLDTLSAAYAEAGRFAEAVATARKAKEAAEKAGDHALVEGIDARIKLYEAHKPYRDPILAEQ